MSECQNVVCFLFHCAKNLGSKKGMGFRLRLLCNLILVVITNKASEIILIHKCLPPLFQNVLAIPSKYGQATITTRYIWWGGWRETGLIEWFNEINIFTFSKKKNLLIIWQIYRHKERERERQSQSSTDGVWEVQPWLLICFNICGKDYWDFKKMSKTFAK